MSIVAARTLHDPLDHTSSSTHWPARLDLAFALREGRTTLVHRAHVGPLVVQKSLYPEGPVVCQCVIVHPPGGIAGGDSLDLHVHVGPDAHAQLVTPGAAKWYRSGGREARQGLAFDIANGASLEWLPHENIVFDGADARMHTRIVLAGS